MLHEEEEEEKRKEQLTPEPTQTKLAVPNKPVPMASPDTRRRAEMIKVDVSMHTYLYAIIQSISGWLCVTV